MSVEEENIVVKNILNLFFEEITHDELIPDDLVKDIEELRKYKKLSKGNNLKSLLTSIEESES